MREVKCGAVWRSGVPGLEFAPDTILKCVYAHVGMHVEEPAYGGVEGLALHSQLGSP